MVSHLESILRPKFEETKRLHGGTAPGKHSPEISGQYSGELIDYLGSIVGCSGDLYSQGKQVMDVDSDLWQQCKDEKI